MSSKHKKRDFHWQLILGVSLVSLSVVLYILHAVIFQDVYHIFYYLLLDMAFIPINVLIVTIIIDKVLNQRERKSMLNKLNMVIGAFFNEVGNELLTRFCHMDPKSQSIGAYLKGKKTWSDSDFSNVAFEVGTHQFEIDCEVCELEGMQLLMQEKREFLLHLLENQNLLEHDTFTDLLWAVFHMTDELCHRPHLDKLSEADRLHLFGDMKRAYSFLVKEWLNYMKHLRDDYPYLFALAIRTNPFDPNASWELKD